MTKEQQQKIETILLHQLKHFWIDIDDVIIRNAIPNAINSIEENFRDLPNKRYFCNGKVQFSPYISIHWMLFLYRLSHEIFLNYGNKTLKESDQLYYLNKILHSNDWLYSIDLPVHFLCEHPLGSVLGRAKYGDYFFVYQGTTVGGNRNNGKLYYPTIGNNVILYSNSSVIGNSHVGNNVVISANSYIINEDIPDNCIVFGKSPNLVFKSKTESEIKSFTKHIWGW